MSHLKRVSRPTARTRRTEAKADVQRRRRPSDSACDAKKHQPLARRPEPNFLEVVDYRVAHTPTNKSGQLLTVRIGGRAVPKREYAALSCWEFLQGRLTPCARCPLFGETGSTARWAVLREGGTPYQLIELDKHASTADVTLTRLSDGVVTALCEEKLQQLARSARLSSQETRVLELVATGSQTKEIANALVYSAPTAKFHGTNMLRKIGADSRLALLRLMITPVSRA
jgi:DNA-binding CsgD family transcriptional regulator